ncbi:MAG: phytoene desaturase family protein [Gemmatimonadales bacterium]
MRGTSYDVVVIGAGHNGLTAAAYLAERGMQVLVLERRDAVGGAAVTEEFTPGFRVDSAAHRLPAAASTIAAELGLSAQSLSVVEPDAAVVAPLADGGQLLCGRDPRDTIQSIRRLSAHDAVRWKDFTNRIAATARFLSGVSVQTPARLPDGGLEDLWKLVRLGGALRGLGKRDMMETLRILSMSAAELLDEWFESEALKGVLAASAVTGAFQGPMGAGSALLLASQHPGDGVYPTTRIVRGGMGCFSDAVASAARTRGAAIRTGAAVERVLVSEGRARGVVLDSGEEIAAQRVVSNADPRRTFLGLVGPSVLDPEFLRKVRAVKYRGACAKVHLALDGLPEFAGPVEPSHLSGVIAISPSIEYLERAYDDAKYGRVSERPFLEIVIPTLTDESLAPPGKHVASVLVQYAPYHLADGAWADATRDVLGDRVLDTLAQFAPGIEERVLAREVVAPPDYEERFGLTEGHPSHGEMTLDQLFFMRPLAGWAQYRTPVRALYLCGAGTHPGGGVTGLPGRNAAREILRDAKRGL